jgi:hypothetical protein
MDKANIPNCANLPYSCGLSGAFSNYGTSPAWSPYTGAVIREAISRTQNNSFTNNTYVGDWHFMPRDQGTVVSYATWQTTWGQDVNSTFTGASDTTPTVPTAPATPLAPAAPTPAPNSTVKTFETGADNMAGWFGATVAQSAAHAHRSAKSLAVTEDGTFWGIEERWPGTSRVNGGDVYTISAWVRSSSVPESLNLRVRWMNRNAIELGTSATVQGTATSSGWTQLFENVTAPADAYTAQFIVSSAGGSVGNVLYMDDLSVVSATKTFETGVDDMIGWFGATVAQSTASAHRGANSLAVTEGGTFWGVEERWPGTTQVKGGTKYAISAWVRSSSVPESINLKVRWINRSSSTTISVPLVARASATSGGWTQLTGDIIAPDSADTAEFVISSGGGSAGNVLYVDDLSVVCL